MKINKAGYSRRGISIVEAVIAIAIIMIVSMSAISLQIAMIESEKKSARNAEIIQLADDTLDCFNWAANGADFKTAMLKLGFQPPQTPDVKYTLTAESGYGIEVWVDYTEQPYQFEFNATTESGDEIYSFAYEK